MNFEEILKSEFGEEKVIIDYSKQSIDNTIGITIISKDGKREFKANKVFFTNDYIELDGRRYSPEDFIMALNVSFDKKK